MPTVQIAGTRIEDFGRVVLFAGTDAQTGDPLTVQSTAGRSTRFWRDARAAEEAIR